MHDVIIIGAGPAGLTAAIYTGRREMKTLIIGREVGGQIVLASEIENYPGFITIDNFELINRFKEQALQSGTQLQEAEVKTIEKNDDSSFTVYTDQETYQAKTIILTIGLAPRRLSVPGEIKLNGRGVSYCVNCDGPFYRHKTVAVIGSGNAAFDAAEIMSKIAKQVYLINRSNDFKAFEYLITAVKNRSNIEIITQAETKAINGQTKVESLTYYDKQTNQDKTINLDGVFIEIGRIASTDFLTDLVDRDSYGQILVDQRQATKTPGLFAAGDAVSGEFKQITIASGQATIAALAAYQYLQQKA